MGKFISSFDERLNDVVNSLTNIKIEEKRSCKCHGKSNPEFEKTLISMAEFLEVMKKNKNEANVKSAADISGQENNNK